MGLSLKEFVASFTLSELRDGLAVTLRYMFKPKITVQYPEERTPYSPRFRGEHALRLHEDGKERCVACKLCEAACPAQAIYIEIDTKSTVENRRTQVYEIDQAKCIFCGYCQEACPVEAVVLGPNFEYYAETRGDLIFDKQKLLDNGKKYKSRIDANLAAVDKYL